MAPLKKQMKASSSRHSDRPPPTPMIPTIPLPSISPARRTSTVVSQGRSIIDKRLVPSSTQSTSISLHSHLSRPDSSHSRPYYIIPTINHNLVSTPVDIAGALALTSARCEPATNPPVRTLRIRSCLLWEVTVTSSLYPYVTIGDILQSLDRALRHHLTPMEMMEIYGSNSHSPAGAIQSYDEWRPGSPLDMNGGAHQTPRRIDTMPGGTIVHFNSPLIWDLGLWQHSCDSFIYKFFEVCSGRS